jgi:hypothetical protein
MDKKTPPALPLLLQLGQSFALFRLMTQTPFGNGTPTHMSPGFSLTVTAAEAAYVSTTTHLLK